MTPAEELGPIRPEHADGWRLEGTEHGGWWLSKRLGPLCAQVRGTTPTTCSWTVYGPDGRLLRETSCGDVDRAKTDAMDWMKEWTWRREFPSTITPT